MSFMYLPNNIDGCRASKVRAFVDTTWQNLKQVRDIPIAQTVLGIVLQLFFGRAKLLLSQRISQHVGSAGASPAHQFQL